MKKGLGIIILLTCVLTLSVIISDAQNTDTWSNGKPADKNINNLEGVNMTVKEGTTSATRLTVKIKNNSGSQCIYGEYYRLEKKINGSWYQVPVVINGNYGFDDIGYNLPSGGESELPVVWDWLYGSLDTGEYRIVKDILDFKSSGEYDTYYLAAEFTI